MYPLKTAVQSYRDPKSPNSTENRSSSSQYGMFSPVVSVSIWKSVNVISAAPTNTLMPIVAKIEKAVNVLRITITAELLCEAVLFENILARNPCPGRYEVQGTRRVEEE